MFEKMDQQQLQSLIKQAMETIQSFLILLPPMVVDCSPCPDLDSGAYPGKKIAGSTEHCVTTLSALFYSYEGESVTKTGECVSTSNIRENILTPMFSGQYPYNFLHENEKKFVHTRQCVHETPKGKKEQRIEQNEDQNDFPPTHYQKQNDTHADVNLVTEIKEMKQAFLHATDSYEKALKHFEQHQQEHNDRQQHQLLESNEKQLQQIEQLTERQQRDHHQKYEQQLQELRVLIEGVRQDNQQLRETTRRNQETETTIQQLYQDIHYLHTVLDKSHWVIERDEIHLTEEVISREGWGEVKVGFFRGTKVAVKCVHRLILSQYNFSFFSGEMDFASRVRHPNLLQFIGATRAGNPIILTEFMPTSLHEEITKKSLTGLQILTISRNIALALNYLHLWRPQPILHRDVCSRNVLLEPSGHNLWKGKLSDCAGSVNIQHILSSTVCPTDPAYAAPESNYPNDHSPAMDVYSFGVLLLEMVVQCHPPLTTIEKEELIRSIQWDPMKAIIEFCTKENKNERLKMSDILRQITDIHKT